MKNLSLSLICVSWSHRGVRRLQHRDGGGWGCRADNERAIRRDKHQGCVRQSNDQPHKAGTLYLGGGSVSAGSRERAQSDGRSEQWPLQPVSITIQQETKLQGKQKAPAQI